MEWIQSINQAINYVETNICEDFVIEDIAKNIYLSSFHFQRIFRLLTGITVSEYIRNRRLSLAGCELSKKETKVIDIAVKYGYDSPESFTKAFTRFHGITPNQAKKEGAVLKAFAPIVIKIKLEGGSIMDYKIVTKEAFDIIAMTRVFDEKNSSEEIPKFWSEFFSRGYNKVLCGQFGICHGLEDGKFKYSIADTYTEGKNIPEGFEKMTIPPYTWAIFKCIGPMPQAIQEMWKKVYSEWLPNSEYELIPAYDIEMYTEGDVKSEEYESEIWIPVSKKISSKTLSHSF